MKRTRPEQEAFVAVQLAAERLSQQAALVIKPNGITGVQYNVLRILRGARPDGLNCGQIAERMINREPDMTRLLDRLEARAWVRRERPAGNRRVVLAFITEGGLEMLAQLDAPMLDLHKRQFQSFTQAQFAQLLGLLSLAGHTKEGA